MLGLAIQTTEERRALERIRGRAEDRWASRGWGLGVSVLPHQKAKEAFHLGEACGLFDHL